MLTMMLTHSNDPKEWIFDQCYRNGSVELNKKRFTYFFPGKADQELQVLQRFCRSKNLTFLVNEKKRTFTFRLDQDADTNF